MVESSGVASAETPPSRTAQRRHAIMRALSPNTVISVGALSRLTGVSAVTVRRDLGELAHAGLVTRVHGGALRAPRRGAGQPFALRRTEDTEAKRLLAQRTAALIEDGESVIIDNGTTCDMVAEELAGRDITVLALSLRAAGAMAEIPGARVTVPGGAVENGSLAMQTATAVDAVRSFRADVAVLGACAASPEGGLTCTEAHDAVLKHEIVRSASRCLLPSTARKLTRSSTFRFAALRDVTDLLTTEDIPPEILTALEEGGVQVTVCP